jgi:hypothetical protein
MVLSLVSCVLQMEAGGRAQPPPRPTLDAQYAADFVDAHRELVENERIVDDVWVKLSDAFHVHEDAVRALQAFAFAPEPPGQLDTQAHARKLELSLVPLAQALGFLLQAWRVAGPGRDDITMLAADVLAHRPGQMALFTHPGAPLEAPIDTPTLGPRLTDDDVLVRAFGLNFFGQ